MREAATICPRPCDLDLGPFNLENGGRVVVVVLYCRVVSIPNNMHVIEVGYLCANFSLPRPLCSRLRPDVRDTQTDVRQHHRLMPPPRGGHNKYN